MPKRVAVTYRYEEKARPYFDALRLAGVEPVSARPDGSTASLGDVSGLVLSGGTDLNPKLYGAARDGRGGKPDHERDLLEWRLLAEALARDLPVLAICRGMQLFNVFHSGTLVQHIDAHRVQSADPSEPAHDVRQAPGTRLAAILGDGPVPVNSRHHQAVDVVGRGLVVSSRAVDGVIEGLERPDLRFAVAVQWHPEDQVRRFVEQRALFDAFGEAL